VLIVTTIFTVAGCDQRVSTAPRPDSAVAMSLRKLLEESGGEDAAGAANGSTASPTGFATLKGRFVISGNPPANPEISINKDSGTCGATAKNLKLVINPNADGGGITSVLVFADGVPDAWLHDSAKGNSDDFIFDQKKCVFLTRVSAFQVSQRFKILNSDPVGHNTDISTRRGAGFNQIIPAGGFAYYQATAEEKEPAPVKCSIHPWMQSWMIPRNNGYFAVTDPDGNFEIPDLPAGVELTFRAWHEIPEFLGSVEVNGEAQKWKKGKFSLNLEPDTPHEMQVTISASEFE